MLKKTEQRLEKIIFNSRWLLAPFYLGLVLGIILLFINQTQLVYYTATCTTAFMSQFTQSMTSNLNTSVCYQLLCIRKVVSILKKYDLLQLGIFVQIITPCSTCCQNFKDIAGFQIISVLNYYFFVNTISLFSFFYYLLLVYR